MNALLAMLNAPGLEADLALQEAHRDGYHTGRLLLSSSLNPHAHGTDLAAQWQSGWQSATNEYMKGKV